MSAKKAFLVISHKSAQNHTKSPHPAPHKACRFYQAALTPPRIDHYPTFEPSTKSVDLLTVETFAGTVCEYADMPKEWTTTRGLYASFRYEGNWENYPDWVRNIYLIELPARGLARVNGSDIERFYYNEDFVEKDGNDVVCEIFIPVRPV